MLSKQIQSFLYLVSSNLISKGAWAICQIIMVRCLGTGDFGILVTIWSFSIITASMLDLGTSQVLLREGSRKIKTAHQLAVKAQKIQLILSTIFFIIFYFVLDKIILSSDLNHTERMILLFTALLTPFIDRFQCLYTVFCQLLNKMQIYSLTRSGYFLLLLGVFLMMAVTGIGNTLVWYSSVYLIVTVCAILFIGIKTWRLLSTLPRTHITYFTSLQLIREGIPYLNLSLLAIAYGRIETTVLGMAGFTKIAGVYHITYQVILLFFSISGMLFTITFPRLYKNYSNITVIQSDFVDTVRWLSLISWIFFPLMIIYSDSIIFILIGNDTFEYTNIFKILSLFILLLPGTAILNFLLPMNMQNERIKFDIIGIMIVVSWSFISITINKPQFMAAGSVTGYLVSIIMSSIALQNKTGLDTLQVLSESISIGKLSVPAILLLSLWNIPWWIGSFLYLLYLMIILYYKKHPLSIRILSILNPTVSNENSL